jgi:hypothetical protein
MITVFGTPLLVWIIKKNSAVEKKNFCGKNSALEKNMRKKYVRKCGFISHKHSLQAVFNREKNDKNPYPVLFFRVLHKVFHNLWKTFSTG